MTETTTSLARTQLMATDTSMEAMVTTTSFKLTATTLTSPFDVEASTAVRVETTSFKFTAPVAPAPFGVEAITTVRVEIRLDEMYHVFVTTSLDEWHCMLSRTREATFEYAHLGIDSHYCRNPSEGQQKLEMSLLVSLFLLSQHHKY